jgi:hypothetical protein
MKSTFTLPEEVFEEKISDSELSRQGWPGKEALDEGHRLLFLPGCIGAETGDRSRGQWRKTEEFSNLRSFRDSRATLFGTQSHPPCVRARAHFPDLISQWLTGRRMATIHALIAARFVSVAVECPKKFLGLIRCHKLTVMQSRTVRDDPGLRGKSVRNLRLPGVILS